MKKSTKLLSVLLAILMIFSSMSVMASAYETYNDGQEKVYDSNDKGAAILLTDEQRASWLCDTVNGLLASANIKMNIAVIGTVDLTSIDALFDTMDNLEGWVSGTAWLVNLGDIESMNLDAFKNNAGMSVNNQGGAVAVINQLLLFLDNNASWLASIIEKGSLDLGLIGSFVDISMVNQILADVPGMIKGLIYDLGLRQISNGIGDDPKFPNDTQKYADLKEKPALDTIVVDLLKGLLTEPRHTKNITDPSQNLICTQPEAYGATAAMIHNEKAVDQAGQPVLDKDGKQVTWYYIYGTQDATTGVWTFTQASKDTTGAESDKQYITHWDEYSVLAPTLDVTLLDGLKTTPLYNLVGKVLPWAYDAFGAPNLDGQLRATIMQFLGAKNVAVTDPATIAQLRTLMNQYKAIGKDSTALGAMSDAYEAAVGAAGNNNFAYFSLSKKDINTMPDDLYYVVEWNGGWEFYKVDFTGVVGEKADLFKMINWEWQAPSWAEIMPAGHNAETTSSLRNITDAMGKILAKAVKSEYLNWVYDASNQDNAHFEDNVMGLIKLVVKTAPVLILGADDAVKAANIDTLTNEQVLVLIGADVMEWLMPALVFPKEPTCLEELIVYGVREFVAEIMPENSWDDTIATAKTDADYLNIALDMGASIAIYYLKNVMALGITTTNGTATSYDNKVDELLKPSKDVATGWNTKLDYVVTAIVTYWVPGLSAAVKAKHPNTFAGTDSLMKLSAIFNDLFPSLLSLISGCTEADADGIDVVSMKKAKDLLAGVLNAKVEPLAKAVYRNETSQANNPIYQIVVDFLKALTDGLGFDASNDYNALTGCLDTALAQANPLDYLISKASIKALLSNLIWVITDTETTKFWVQDALRIVMQATGAMDDTSFKGARVGTDQTAYYGASVTVTPSVTVSADGVPAVFYDGGYRSGNRTVDGKYTAKLVKYVVRNFDGSVMTTVDVNTALTINTVYNATKLTLTPTDTMSIYTLEAHVEVTSPEGIVINNGQPIVVNTSFMMTKAAQGDDTAAQIIDDGDKNIDTAFWNIYIDETEPLNKAADYQMTVYNRETGLFASARTFYIKDYGYNVKQPDGSIRRGSNSDGSGTPKAGTATWTKYINTSTQGQTVESGSDQNMVFYWNWNSSSQKVDKDSSLSHQQWLVDATVDRSAFPDDFTTLLFTSNSSVLKAGTREYSWKFSPPYIVIYNSYGLKNLIDRELASGKQAENYEEASWKAYQDALAAAVAEYYAPRKASTFAADHTNPEGVSEFKTNADAVKAAAANLKTKTTSQSSSDYTPEEKAALAQLKTLLDGQEGKKNLNNQNYYMYRWLRYYNEYAWLSNIYNGAQIPSGIAPNKLAGVPSDNATIDAVIKAAATDKQAALNAMVKEPTAEEIAAAKLQKDNFTANLPKIDIPSMQIDAAQMKTYESRLIAKPANAQYLTSALTLVASAQQQDYTAQSWARFAAAKTVATAAQASKVPSEIHQARYDLLCAYKGLTAANTDVDLTELETVMKTVDGIFANPSLYKVSAAGTAAGYKTLNEAMAAVLAEAGVKVELNGTTYFVGGNDTGAAWLEEAGKRTAVEAQATVDRVVKEIKAALANVECSIQLVPDKELPDNQTDVDALNKIVEGITPGSINTQAELLKLVKADAPAGYTPKLAVKQAAAFGFGTGTTITVTLDNAPNWSLTNTVVIYGDLNGDGAVDLFDAALLERNIAGKTGLSAFAKQASDANADGLVALADFDMIANASVGNGTISQTRP